MASNNSSAKKSYIGVGVCLDNFTTRKLIIKEKRIILGHKTETMLASDTSLLEKKYSQFSMNQSKKKFNNKRGTIKGDRDEG